MLLFNSEINLILTWSTDCVISSAAGETKFAIADTKFYVPIVILLTQDNAKLLQQIIQVLREKLIGIHINQKLHQKDKVNI